MGPGTNLVHMPYKEFQECHATSQAIVPLFCQHLFSIITLCKIVLVSSKLLLKIFLYHPESIEYHQRIVIAYILLH